MFFNPCGMTLEINNRRRLRKFTNQWKLNTLLNDQSKRNHKGTRKYFEMKENKNMPYQNLWDADKVMLTKKCTASDTSYFEKKRDHHQQTK